MNLQELVPIVGKTKLIIKGASLVLSRISRNLPDNDFGY